MLEAREQLGIIYKGNSLFIPVISFADKGPHLSDILIQTLSVNPTKPHSNEEKSAKQGVKLLGALVSDTQSPFDHIAGCHSLVLNLLVKALNSTSSVVKCGALSALASLRKSIVESMDSEVLCFVLVENTLFVQKFFSHPAVLLTTLTRACVSQ